MKRKPRCFAMRPTMNAEPATPRNVRVGWLTDDDANRVQRIDLASAIGLPWSYSEILKAIRSRVPQKCVRVDGLLVAFSFVDYGLQSSILTRIAVDPSHRRRGYGRLLIDDAVKLLHKPRTSLVAEIKESVIAAHEDAALSACRFFQRAGFTHSHVADRFGVDPSWVFIRRRRFYGIK